jgi:hypothetical protein
MSASRLVLSDRICVENGIRHLLTAPYSPTTTGRWSGCTRRCAASCSTSTTGAGARSARRRRRWTGGSTSTTPTGHTDPSAADHRSSGSRWPGSVSTRSATTMRGLPLAGLRLRRRGRRGVAVGGRGRADPAGQAALPGWGAVRRSAGRGRRPGRAGRDPARRSPRGHACAARQESGRPVAQSEVRARSARKPTMLVTRIADPAARWRSPVSPTSRGGRGHARACRSRSWPAAVNCPRSTANSSGCIRSATTPVAEMGAFAVPNGRPRRSNTAARAQGEKPGHRVTHLPEPICRVGGGT